MSPARKHPLEKVRQKITPEEEVHIIKAAGRYISTFQGRYLVIKLGGAALVHNEVAREILGDVAFLKKVGMHPIIVHGGGQQASQSLQAAGIENRIVDGIRITSREAMVIIKDVFMDINAQLVDWIEGFGVLGLSIPGDDSGLVAAKVMENPEHPELDYQYTGRVFKINTYLLHLQDQNRVPVITCLGRGPRGQTFNINADYVATELASALRAEKLVFLTNVDGLLRDPEDPESLVSTCTFPLYQELLNNGKLTGGMRAKLDACLNALRKGVNKIHIINGKKSHSLLLELLTDMGIGTQILLEEEAQD